jgi:hypothetical protein
MNYNLYNNCESLKYDIEQLNCDMVDESSGQGEYKVTNQLPEPGTRPIIFYAANPPTLLHGFSGSGLPFPNATHAYENTPNIGKIMTDANGTFEFNLRYPNAYYAGLGTKYINPHYYIKDCQNKKVYLFKLGEGIPFRMLTYPTPENTKPRVNVGFYANGGREMPPRSQEQILRDSAYPLVNKMPENFWGKKPQQ